MIMTAKDFKKIILDKLNVGLKADGFKRKGNIFQKASNELNYFIQLQSSQSSTATILRLTFNIEISSPLLYELEGTSIPEKDQRHYVERIGCYLDDPIDKWWTVTSAEEVELVTVELLSIINNKVLHNFHTLTTLKDLRNLWQQGKSPGLTERKRQEYLSLLENHTQI